MRRERERDTHTHTHIHTQTQATWVRILLFMDAVNCHKYTALIVYELNMSMDIDGMVQTGTSPVLGELPVAVPHL